MFGLFREHFCDRGCDFLRRLRCGLLCCDRGCHGVYKLQCGHDGSRGGDGLHQVQRGLLRQYLGLRRLRRWHGGGGGSFDDLRELRRGKLCKHHGLISLH